MTVVKQVAVTSAAHMKNLARYLDDGRALLRGSQNLVDPKGWEGEFARTRAAFGHDVASRAGAKNTVAFHQVIAFLPEESSCSGGPMTPERCMEYAREWMGRYPNQEAVWCLHEERAADGTLRYAVHIAINRTDLETGRRLNEGPSKVAKRDRAAAIREMDGRWGLRQLERGVRNSAVHARQQTPAERSLEGRGAKTDKAYIRERVRLRVAEAKKADGGNRVRALARSLKEDGIEMRVSADRKDFVFSHGRAHVRATKLGRGFSMAGITHALGVGGGLARLAVKGYVRAVERAVMEYDR